MHQVTINIPIIFQYYKLSKYNKLFICKYYLLLCNYIIIFITGNIWAQSWSNLLDVTLPYPGKTYPDVTPEMQAQVRSFYTFLIL